MRYPALLAAVLAALVLHGPVAAQETTAPAPEATPEAPAAATTDAPADAATAAPAEGTEVPPELSTGVPAEAAAGGVGSTYVQSVHGDWEERCVRMADGSDPCQLYQLLKDPSGNPVAEFAVFGVPEGQQQQLAAGATVIVPLETLLTQQLTLQIDSSPAKKYPFSWCSPVGCISRIGFTQAEVDQLKAGVVANVTIVPVVAPDQKVVVKASLKGFTAGLEAVNKSNGK